MIHRRAITASWLSGLMAVACLLHAACTVTPQPVTSAAASFEGNKQTSGVIAETSAGFTVSADLRARFNALAPIYGRAFAGGVAADTGLTPNADGTWTMTREAMVKFLTMNRLRRMGWQPQ